ncbi:MAG: hypothetical protein JSV19_13855 [Phycisphaerales bacterium]|nr:MAG: hypothetical protein JSV19_13855 [Phycisphaerales bacterium]
MADLESSTALDTSASPAPSEGRWPAWTAIFASGIAPRTLARRTTHVGLRSAYAVHVAGILLAVAAVIFVIFLERLASALDSANLSEICLHMVRDIQEVLRYFHARPIVWTIRILLSFMGIEAIYLLVALVVMSWGAGDEPFAVSVRSAVQRVWLHTPHVAIVILTAGSVIILVERSRVFWPGMYGPAMVVLTLCSSGMWLLWALLGVVGAPRPSLPSDLPPMCEWCGYNLTHIPTDGRCSECGRPVIESLGEGVRPGVAWQRREVIPPLRAWWRCTIDGALRAAVLGRTVRVTGTGREHRVFLVTHLVLVFLAAAFGCACSIIATDGASGPEWEILLALPSLVGCLAVGLAVGIAVLAASAVGIAFQIMDKRNLMRASMQVAAYGAGFLVFWTVVAYGTVVGLVMIENVLDDLAWALGYPIDSLAIVLWCVPNLFCLVAYFSLVARGTAAARYANR